MRAGHVDAPYVDECPVVVELALHNTLELGSHTQFIGEIKDVKIDKDCLDDMDKPNINLVNPLLYDGGGREYRQVGAHAGKAFAGGKIFWNRGEE